MEGKEGSAKGGFSKLIGTKSKSIQHFSNVFVGVMILIAVIHRMLYAFCLETILINLTIEVNLTMHIKTSTCMRGCAKITLDCLEWELGSHM